MLKKLINIRLSVLALSALFAGLCNGFLGTGGGIILVFALSLVNIDQRDKFATVIAVILPLSIISLAFYDVKFSDSSVYILPGIIGGICGALLLDKMRVSLLKKLFAVMVIWAGYCFLK